LSGGLKAFEPVSRSLAASGFAEDVLKKIAGNDLNQGTNCLWAWWWEKAGIYEERGNPRPLAVGCGAPTLRTSATAEGKEAPEA